MGNSSVHNLEFKGYTDSVTFGEWKKDIFIKTGFFDVSLKRNQDDEFHYRARSFGYKIYQHPDIKLYYYPRDNWLGLWKQYFEYGLYKPRVLRKVSSEMKIRHLIPSLFVCYLLSFPLIFIIGLAWFIPFFSYVLLAFYFTLKAKASNAAKLFCLIVYPTVHFAYGTGFIIGLFKK